MMPIDGKYQRLYVIHIFWIVLTVSVILTFQMFYLENLGQGH